MPASRYGRRVAEKRLRRDRGAESLLQRDRVIGALLRRDRVVGFFILVCGMAAATFGAYLDARPAVRTALLVDELSVFEPHPAFVRDVGAALVAAGYAMAYVPPQDVTVERLRSLPGDLADLIILRSHAALIVKDGRWTEDAALFSSEPVDLVRFDVTALRALDPSGLDDPPAANRAAAPVGATRLSAAEAAALVPVRRAVGSDRRPYLGLGARFIRDHLHGRFRDDAVIVLMGCNTLKGSALSDAFLARGARAVIGWNDEVSAAHTDRAIAALVVHLAADGDVLGAIRAVERDVGPDPVSGAILVAAER